MKPSQKHSDAIFYEMAGEEVQKGAIDKGLMAKAAVKSGGDKRKAEKFFISSGELHCSRKRLSKIAKGKSRRPKKSERQKYILLFLPLVGFM